MVVIDTNVLISYALVPNSVPGQCVLEVLKRHDLAFSETTYAELCRVMKREKFVKYIGRESRETFLQKIAERGQWMDAEELVDVKDCRDEKDNMFLAVAHAASADFLISGDDDLLVLHPWRGISILSPSDMLRALA